MGRETAAITPIRRRELVEQGCTICGRKVFADGFCRRHAPIAPEANHNGRATPVIRDRARHRSYAGQPTRRREAILGFIFQYKTANDGNSPAMRDIGAACGISSASLVVYYLNRLNDDGLIEFDECGGLVVIGGRWEYTGPEIADPLLARIVEYKLNHNGNSPSLDWLTEQDERAQTAVHYHLTKLEAAGLVDRLPVGKNGRRGALVVKGGRWKYEGVRP